MKFRHAALAAILSCATGWAQAHIVSYTGTLAPEAVGATGSGTVLVEYQEEVHLLTISTTFSGLSGLTSVAHIHCCTVLPETGTVGVAVQAPTLTGFPVGVSAATYGPMNFDLSLDGVMSNPFIAANGGSKASAEAALIAALDTGRAYFNIHTLPNFPGGEIRAFLTPVPEPQSLALVLAGLGLVGFIAHRTRRSDARSPGR